MVAEVGVGGVGVRQGSAAAPRLLQLRDAVCVRMRAQTSKYPDARRSWKRVRARSPTDAPQKASITARQRRDDARLGCERRDP